VPVHFEYPAVIDPDTLENAITIQQAMIKDADARLILTIELAVDIYLHWSLPGPTRAHCLKRSIQ
jgi:hypothetical protein